MINGIGPSGTNSVRASGSQRTTAAVAAAPVGAADDSSAPSPAADLAAAGPPVNATRVAAIQAAIATGTYAIDAQAIAEKMLALDLPVKG